MSNVLLTDDFTEVDILNKQEEQEYQKYIQQNIKLSWRTLLQAYKLFEEPKMTNPLYLGHYFARSVHFNQVLSNISPHFGEQLSISPIKTTYYYINNESTTETQSIHNTILLFEPCVITIEDKINTEFGHLHVPTLSNILNQLKDILTQSTNNISRVLIPIGEINNRGIVLPQNKHAILYVIDIQKPSIDSNQYMYICNIIDSKKNGWLINFLGYNRTEYIHNITFDILQKERCIFQDRIWLNHQGLLDNQRCCYYVLKMIQVLIKNYNKQMIDIAHNSCIRSHNEFYRLFDIPEPRRNLFVSEETLLNQYQIQEINNLIG
jgi:hypothetical protein